MRDTPILASALLLGVLFALAAALVIEGTATMDMSRHIYLTVDLPGFAAVLLATLTVVLALRLLPAEAVAWAGRRSLTSPAIPWALAALALALTVAGTDLVHHRYAFSMDEWMVQLQGTVFAEGHMTGEVPEALRTLGRAMYHDFARYDVETGQLASSYRPGMAALYAGFEAVGIGGVYVSAAMTAASVLLVASLARRIWPDRAEAPAIAALLLASSQQALAMGLTSYAMPAHLCLNLLWLRLFLSDSWPGHLLAPWIGVATASLHQIHPHLFFALPFLLLLLRPGQAGRVPLVLYYGAVYAVGHLAIWHWNPLMPTLAAEAAQAAGGPGAATAALDGGLAALEGLWAKIQAIAGLPGPAALASVFANLVRLFAWQSLALVPLLLMLRWRSPPALTVLLTASIALSLLPYPILMPDQGHGWGYRYLHGLIGNLALLGTAGWLALARQPDAARLRLRAATLGLLAATAVALVPLRAAQISDLVGRHAAASARISSMPAELVIVDDIGALAGRDLTRNAPLGVAEPVGLSLRPLPAGLVERLCDRFRVAAFTRADAAGFGLVLTPLDAMNRLFPDYPERREALASPRCAEPPG